MPFSPLQTWIRTPVKSGDCIRSAAPSTSGCCKRAIPSSRPQGLPSIGCAESFSGSLSTAANQRPRDLSSGVASSAPAVSKRPTARSGATVWTATVAGGGGGAGSVGAGSSGTVGVFCGSVVSSAATVSSTWAVGSSASCRATSSGCGRSRQPRLATRPASSVATMPQTTRPYRVHTPTARARRAASRASTRSTDTCGRPSACARYSSIWIRSATSRRRSGDLRIAARSAAHSSGVRSVGAFSLMIARSSSLVIFMPPPRLRPPRPARSRGTASPPAAPDARAASQPPRCA